ncbi:hypothetical protein ABKN59_005956 [Abortiporus biennis]
MAIVEYRPELLLSHMMAVHISKESCVDSVEELFSTILQRIEDKTSPRKGPIWLSYLTETSSDRFRVCSSPDTDMAVHIQFCRTIQEGSLGFLPDACMVCVFQTFLCKFTEQYEMTSSSSNQHATVFSYDE